MPVSLQPRVRSFPSFTREGLSWRSVAPDRVEIAVLVSNDGPESTQPGDLVIEAAALGAFVPFRPVARIALGSLEPGERRRVTTLVPRRVLQGAGLMPMARIMGDFLKRLYGPAGADARLLDELAHAEWIGNLNVYFDRRPERAVERHCAFGLKVEAGRSLAAMLVLPEPVAGYEVGTSCTSPDWKAEVLRFGPGLACLLVRPPAACGERAGVTVLVTRASDGREVPVEFEFETSAGPGEKLCCVTV